MKQSFLLSILVTGVGFLLPVLLSPPRLGAQETPEAPPAPAAAAPVRDRSDIQVLDGSVVLAVQTEAQITEMTMAEYLPLAMAAEMPAAFSDEALKAQAVALRTYALRYRANRKAAHPEADVCSDPGCCAALETEEHLRSRWGENYGVYMEKLSAAAAATDGQYLVWEDEPALTVFHASSLDVTEDGAALGTALPYLVSVSTPETPETVQNLCTTVEVSAADFAATVTRTVPEASLPEDDPASWVGTVSLDGAGRVSRAVIGGASVSGQTLRQMFSLRSTDFTLAWDGEGQRFLFRVSGYGHGMGMSQHGANLMAKAGKSYGEILEHYYPGTELVMAVLTDSAGDSV